MLEFIRDIRFSRYDQLNSFKQEFFKIIFWYASSHPCVPNPHTDSRATNQFEVSEEFEQLMQTLRPLTTCVEDERRKRPIEQPDNRADHEGVRLRNLRADASKPG
ncbi:hypothetical protein DWB84_05675 [Saccharophagus sp. K07]|nr:hypothetical protein [Saccharophagus sp. K07]